MWLRIYIQSSAKLTNNVIVRYLLQNEKRPRDEHITFSTFCIGIITTKTYYVTITQVYHYFKNGSN